MSKEIEFPKMEIDVVIVLAGSEMLALKRELILRTLTMCPSQTGGNRGFPQPVSPVSRTLAGKTLPCHPERGEGPM